MKNGKNKAEEVAVLLAVVALATLGAGVALAAASAVLYMRR